MIARTRRAVPAAANPLDLLAEDVIRLNEVAQEIPGRVDVSTVWRWAQRGVGGITVVPINDSSVFEGLLMGKKLRIPDGGGASRDRVLAKMQKDTQAIAKRWVAEENELTDSKLQVRYRRAQEFKMVYEQYEKYGEWSFEHLADVLTCLGECFFLHMSVSVYIDEQTFSDVVKYNKRTWAGDWRITWENLVALSRCTNRELQRSILTRCMNERLSVQHVNDLIDAAILPARTMGSNNSREVGSRSITT